jgi:hypothetical protein
MYRFFDSVVMVTTTMATHNQQRIALQQAAGIKRLDTTKLRNGVIVSAILSTIIVAPLGIPINQLS